MATGTVRRKAADNMGGCGQEVAGGEAKGIAGQISVEGFGSHPFYLTAIVPGYNWTAFTRRIRKLIQSALGPDNSHPQLRRGRVDRRNPETESSWPDSLADRRGMDAAQKGADKGKPSTGPSRRIRNQHRTAGK